MRVAVRCGGVCDARHAPPRATGAAAQVRELRKSLAKVANGEAFLLQARPRRRAPRRASSRGAPERAARCSRQ